MPALQAYHAEYADKLPYVKLHSVREKGTEMVRYEKEDDHHYHSFYDDGDLSRTMIIVDWKMYYDILHVLP